jgi:predicted protein tyrosine phosphatase
MNVLFICNQNKHRSKTAEEIFREKFATKSAGLYSTRPVTEKELLWADIIAVMEEEQRHELGKRFPKVYMQKRIVNLDVPDVYSYMQPGLISVLRRRFDEVQALLQ